MHVVMKITNCVFSVEQHRRKLLLLKFILKYETRNCGSSDALQLEAEDAAHSFCPDQV